MILPGDRGSIPQTTECSFDLEVEDKAASIIRRRRSAQAYDGESGISYNHFFDILDKTVPRNGVAPFDNGLNGTHINLLIFLHRVEGLESGLYFYMRNEQDTEELMRACNDRFKWQRIGETRLYLLAQGNMREESTYISCNQAIASDGAFSLAMIARFSELIGVDPHQYRRLHWEAGMIGQTLYLEATAHDLGGTGIGCFLDDLVHELLGLEDNAFQDLYHFTIGRPVTDERLTTLPPYQHLNEE